MNSHRYASRKLWASPRMGYHAWALFTPSRHFRLTRNKTTRQQQRWGIERITPRDFHAGRRTARQELENEWVFMFSFLGCLASLPIDITESSIRNIVPTMSPGKSPYH